VRLIQKWLNAGVLADGQWTRSDVGTPQGGGISPLLANVYLHYAFDLWVHDWRQQAKGDVIVVARLREDAKGTFRRAAAHHAEEAASKAAGDQHQAAATLA
jgi:RNA-directed DNA polymerase